MSSTFHASICDVLIIEDDSVVRNALERVLTRDGYKTVSAGSIEQAMQLITSHGPHTVLLDLALPDGDGVDVIDSLKSNGVNAVIVVSGTNDTQKTHRCLDAGVFDFIVKPARSSDVLRSVRRADANRRQQTVTNQDYPTQLTPGFGALEGHTRIGKELITTIKLIAMQSPGHALITGQPGVLKLDNAALVHHYSKRTGAALLINCASESHKNTLYRFFGQHAVASATNDALNRSSYLDKADQGTLVLDDVSALPSIVQVKLEEFIRSGAALAVDAVRATYPECSVIGVLREPVEQALARGALHEPLYTALSVNTLHVPPLVDRRQDIELFAQLAVDQLNKLFDTEKSLSSELKAQLGAYYWPGNLVELKNCLLTAYRETEPGEEITEIVSLSGNSNEVEDMNIAPFVGQTFKHVEAQLIKATLQANGNNKGRSAKVLGISLKTLYNRLSNMDT